MSSDYNKNFQIFELSNAHSPTDSDENVLWDDSGPGSSGQHITNNSANEDYTDIYNYWTCVDNCGIVNRSHRTTSIHRNALLKKSNEFCSQTLPKTLENRRKWMSPAERTITQDNLEQRANNIVNHMEEDAVLMANSAESELLRREALRNMPQCLAVKRLIKKKLNTSANKQVRYKPIGFFKVLKYAFEIKASKVQNSFKSFAYTFELWYSSLKIIEGHFGSGVATYFKFFRWIFIMNCLIALFTFSFIVLPQLLYISYRIPENGTITSDVNQEEEFSFGDIFTGAGYFTRTALYYGFYTNETLHLIENEKYSMPFAYFFTMFFMYTISFFIISRSMARSYRRSFIETQGGLKNIYAHKIFCGWDYSIATEDAGDLKSGSIFHELKELLGESLQKPVKATLMQRFRTRTVQVISNCFITILLAGTGCAMWFLLEQHQLNSTEIDKLSSNVAVVMAIMMNILMLLFPLLFSFIVRYEDYQHPRAALYITLIRTFMLKTVVVGVFLGFWLTHSANERCWETSIGQHIYRLVFFDFLFSVILTSIIQLLRYLVYKKWSKKLGAPKVNIARYTLQLLYNQTLFWVGLYFSPLLPIVVVIKLWCTWYIRRTCLLKFFQPSSRSWRAAQTHTWFLILSFMSLFLVLFTHAYIIVGIRTSNCGPFRNYSYMYELIFMGIFQLEQNHLFWKIILYLTKPGSVGLILVGMCVVVYYLRAKAMAQKSMVEILKGMLVMEAKDKEFLLKNISKITEGQWQYNLQDPNNLWNIRRRRNPEDDIGEGDETSSGSDNLQDCRRHLPDSLFLPSNRLGNKRKC